MRIHGIDALRRLITEAVPIADDGFQPFLDALNTPRVEPLSLGIPWLENHLIPVRPEFMVIGGQAGHGKSTIVQFLLYSLLHKNPELKASIFHGEGDKHILVERARKFYAGVVMPKVFDETFQRDRDLWVNDKLAFINSPQDVMPTFDWLLGTMERQALHRGRTVFVIDPWNEIILAKPVGQSTTEHVAECIIRMKKLADRHKLILIVAHHVAKPSDFNHPPNRYHLSDSQHWANKADHIVLVWKPNESAEATHINVAKSKDFDRMGRPGEVWVEMVRDTFTFRTVDDPRAKKPTVEERKANAEKAAAEAMDRPASPDPSGGGSSANGHPSFD